MCFDRPSLLLSVQSKIHAARSLSEIAIDLTETGTLKTSKLANMGSKGKIISGSSGSLLSSGQYMLSVYHYHHYYIYIVYYYYLREKETMKEGNSYKQGDKTICLIFVCICLW